MKHLDRYLVSLRIHTDLPLPDLDRTDSEALYFLFEN